MAEFLNEEIFHDLELDLLPVASKCDILTGSFGVTWFDEAMNDGTTTIVDGFGGLIGVFDGWVVDAVQEHYAVVEVGEEAIFATEAIDSINHGS